MCSSFIITLHQVPLLTFICILFMLQIITHDVLIQAAFGQVICIPIPDYGWRYYPPISVAFGSISANAYEGSVCLEAIKYSIVLLKYLIFLIQNIIFQHGQIYFRIFLLLLSAPSETI